MVHEKKTMFEDLIKYTGCCMLGRDIGNAMQCLMGSMIGFPNSFGGKIYLV